MCSPKIHVPRRHRLTGVGYGLAQRTCTNAQATGSDRLSLPLGPVRWVAGHHQAQTGWPWLAWPWQLLAWRWQQLEVLRLRAQTRSSCTKNGCLRGGSSSSWAPSRLADRHTSSCCFRESIRDSRSSIDRRSGRYLTAGSWRLPVRASSQGLRHGAQ